MTKDKLLELLELNGWNQSNLANALGVSKQRISALVKKHGLERPGGVEMAAYSLYLPVELMDRYAEEAKSLGVSVSSLISEKLK